MSLSNEQHAFAINVTRLFEFLIVNDVKFTIGEVMRTPEQQQIYFKEGKSMTLSSKHLDKKAIDLNFWIDGELTYKVEDLRFIGEFWKTLSPWNEWGGDWRFKDTNHFQVK